MLGYINVGKNGQTQLLGSKLSHAGLFQIKMLLYVTLAQQLGLSILK